jgi:DNA-binding CsgD family transcriptional regulator
MPDQDTPQVSIEELEANLDKLSKGLDALDNWLPQHSDVKLVIIDILGKFTSLSSPRNIYQGDYNKIEKIKTLADSHTIAIIVVHHLNKLKDSPDVFDKISGSTGLTGASDTVAVLERSNRAGADAKLHIAGRDVEAAELPLRYDSQRGVWVYAGDAQKYCTTEQRVEIFELLAESGKPMRSREIAEALEKNKNTVRGLLTRMVKKGELKQPGRGLYIIP